MPATALLALEDGSLFYGTAVGAHGTTVGTVVFDTSMTGYQERLTDPANQQLLIAMTYPHIGSAGTNPADAESDQVHAAGLILREPPLKPSNWQSTASLTDYLQSQNTVAIADVDTRHLTELVREKGPLKACIMAGEFDPHEALEQAKTAAGIEQTELVSGVTTRENYEWTQGSWQGPNTLPIEKLGNYHVAVYDFGVKRSLLSALVERGAKVTVVPATTAAEELSALNVDGIVLSGGGGDPAAQENLITVCRNLAALDLPILAVGLGCQVLGLAYGATTKLLPRAHFGANHPVKNIQTGRVSISNQNHCFALQAPLPEALTLTEQSLFDRSVQGFQVTDKPIYGYQGNPEASDSAAVLERLFTAMGGRVEA